MAPVSLPFFQVDAFSSSAFGGNPAAVVLLPPGHTISNALMQKIAAENNLAETAFVEPHPDHPTAAGQDPFAAGSAFKLRWFTPTVEVPLCGHATLAAAAALIYECGNASPTVCFHTLSGELQVTQTPESSGAPPSLEMALPLAEPSDAPPQGLEDVSGPLVKSACGGLQVQEVRFARASGLDYLVLVLADGTTRAQLEALEPDIPGMEAAAPSGQVRGVIVTVAGGVGSEPDFLSRFFGPWLGIAEDHVTGSAHSVLGPLWQARLGKDVMTARQCSARGGDLTVRVVRERNRVVLGGQAAVVISGTIRL